MNSVGYGGGKTITRVDNPRALDRSLSRPRSLHRARSKCTPGSVRYRRRTDAISILNARIANQRSDAIHKLTTRLAKTHGTVVVESLNVSGMLAQRNIPGARRRRRGLSDASMGELRRQMGYKCGWRGSALVEADPLFPSSRLCHVCGERTGYAWRVAAGMTETTMPPSISPAIPRATWARLAPPTSVEPSVRPGSSGLLAVNRRRRARVSQERLHPDASTP